MSSPRPRVLRRAAPVLVVALALATTTAALAAAPVAEGSVRADQADWTVADAMAWHDGDELEVVFSDVPFDRAAMTGDGELDTFDFMRHDGNLVALNFADDGPTMCVDMTTRAGDTVYSGSKCNSDFPPAVSIGARSDSRIAGTMDWSDGGERLQLRFDLPIEAAAPAAAAAAEPAGEPLPPDGGEPARAMLAHFAAVRAGDWEALKALSHPDRRSMMQASEEAGEHQQMFQFLQTFAPTDIRVTGGTVSGDDAQVAYEAREQGTPVKGTADMVRLDGTWYFVGSNTEY